MDRHASYHPPKPHPRLAVANMWKQMAVVVVIAWLALMSTASTTLNPRPVIGVLYQPMEPSLEPLCATCTSYLVASYVRWLQGAGARVALLDYAMAPSELNSSFSQLSGLLFTGGHCGYHNTSYGNAGVELLKLAVQAGDFPVWGICQGFQQLAQFSTGFEDPSILHETGNATDGVALPLNLTADGSTSRMLVGAPPDVISTLTTAPVTMNLHHYSVLVNESRLHPQLASFWRYIATNSVDGGAEFVSLMEGKTHPFYASQFHPEKNAGEFDQPWENYPRIDPAVVHGAPAVKAMQYLVDFFVGETRKSPHRWVNSTPECLISYKVAPYYTQQTGDFGWENCYLR